MGFLGLNIEYNEGRVLTPFIIKRGMLGFSIEKTESNTTFFSPKLGFKGFNFEINYYPRAIVRLRRK